MSAEHDQRNTMRTTLLAALLATTSVAQAQPVDFSETVKAVAPAVVNITTESFSMRSMFRMPAQTEEEPVQGQGAGFLISPTGAIVTNNHVVEGAQTIRVELQDGTEYEATLVGTDPLTDIALLDIEGDDHPVLTFADSDSIEVGDWALAVGNPLGQGFSVSLGIVSARGRTLSGAFDDYIQTDAAINRGNSGGPLFNAEGEVIGVNTAILSPTGGSIGIGFAMASNVVEEITQQLATYGTTRRGWLGVQMQEITPELAETIGLPNTEGAFVAELLEGPAKAGGLLPGDAITGFNGTPVRDTNDLTRRIAQAGPDATVTIDVWRDQATQTFTIALGNREEAQTALNAQASSGFEGFAFSTLTDSDRERLDLPEAVEGALVSSTPEGNGTPLQTDDVITAINQQPVATPQAAAAALQALKSAGRSVALIQIARAGRPAFVLLPLNR
jgi:serine protease Do